MMDDHDKPDELANRTIARLSKGNPLLDPEAFQKALDGCETEELREFLRILWDAAHMRIERSGPLLYHDHERDLRHLDDVGEHEAR